VQIPVLQAQVFFYDGKSGGTESLIPGAEDGIKPLLAIEVRLPRHTPQLGRFVFYSLNQVLSDFAFRFRCQLYCHKLSPLSFWMISDQSEAADKAMFLFFALSYSTLTVLKSFQHGFFLSGSLNSAAG
jgi:hypothetical protein